MFAEVDFRETCVKVPSRKILLLTLFFFNKPRLSREKKFFLRKKGFFLRKKGVFLKVKWGS